jgi:hypothetical protein
MPRVCTLLRASVIKAHQPIPISLNLHHDNVFLRPKKQLRRYGETRDHQHLSAQVTGLHL